MLALIPSDERAEFETAADATGGTRGLKGWAVFAKASKWAHLTPRQCKKLYESIKRNGSELKNTKVPWTDSELEDFVDALKCYGWMSSPKEAFKKISEEMQSDTFKRTAEACACLWRSRRHTLFKDIEVSFGDSSRSSDAAPRPKKRRKKQKQQATAGLAQPLARAPLAASEQRLGRPAAWGSLGASSSSSSSSSSSAAASAAVGASAASAAAAPVPSALDNFEFMTDAQLDELVMKEEWRRGPRTFEGIPAAPPLSLLPPDERAPGLRIEDVIAAADAKAQVGDGCNYGCLPDWSPDPFWREMHSLLASDESAPGPRIGDGIAAADANALAADASALVDDGCPPGWAPDPIWRQTLENPSEALLTDAQLIDAIASELEDTEAIRREGNYRPHVRGAARQGLPPPPPSPPKDWNPPANYVQQVGFI